MQPEKLAITFIRNYLILVLPITVLITRLLVRWATREKARDVFGSILAIPFDLMFIAMSLLLTGIARMNPKFVENYESETTADLAGAILLVSLIVLAVLIAYLDRWVRILWQKFFSALQQFSRMVPGFDLEAKEPNFPIGGRLVWMLTYWVLLVLALGSETVVSLTSLWYVLRLIG